MAKITFITLDGSTMTVDARIGLSVMEAAMKHDVPGILAECGGACACATCHVHIDADWVPKLTPADDIETGMLEFTEGADTTSRLSCQIKITEALDGLIVKVAQNG